MIDEIGQAGAREDTKNEADDRGDDDPGRGHGAAPWRGAGTGAGQSRAGPFTIAGRAQPMERRVDPEERTELEARLHIIESLLVEYVLNHAEKRQPGLMATRIGLTTAHIASREDIPPKIRAARIANLERIMARVTPRKPWQAATLAEGFAAMVDHLWTRWARRRRNGDGPPK